MKTQIKWNKWIKKKRVKLKNDTKGEIKPSKYETSDKKTQYAWENNNKKSL